MNHRPTLNRRAFVIGAAAAATGKRIRSVPLKNHDIIFA
jgi:hypothetical protein